LCEECESMLNVGGEIWTVGKLCTADRTFPLYDLLDQQAPIDTDADGDLRPEQIRPYLYRRFVTSRSAYSGKLRYIHGNSAKYRSGRMEKQFARGSEARLLFLKT
jgi:hypothetical protein